MKNLILSLAVLTATSVALGQEEQSAQQLYEAGQNERALQAIAQQRERGAAGPAESYLAGQIRLKMRQNDAARAEFEGLVQMDDPTWRLVGESAIAALENDNQRALETSTQAVAMSPDHFGAHFQLGYARARLEDWAGSAEALERATQIDPTFAYAHYNAGLAYSRAKRADRTAEHFERFLKLAPNAPERGGVDSLMRTLRGR